ncbi:MAG TPA: DUF4383 domain-containing protein [Pseudonocardiaceae bacterium]
MTVDPETKFGIKIQTKAGPRTLAQKYSLVAGVIYLAFGVIGLFWTGLGGGTDMMNDMLFGIFMVNPFHNIVHLTVGLLWLLGAFALTPPATEGLNLAIGSFWVLATLLGFLGYLSSLAINSGATPDNYLHLVTAVATLVLGTGLLRAFGGRSHATTA